MEPLENPLIIEKIFAHIPLQNDRGNFRAVNILWRNLSLVEWRRTVFIKFITNQYNDEKVWDEFCNLFHGTQNTSSPSDNIMPLCDEPFFRIKDKPFRRFYLDGNIVLPPYHIIQWDPDVAKIEGKVRFFFEKWGSYIEYLDLSETVKFWNEEFAFCMRWILLVACNNLKELVVRKNIDGRWRPPYACQFQDELDLWDFDRETAEKLRSLHIIPSSISTEFPPRWDNQSVEELFNIVPNLESLHLSILSSRLLDSLKNPLRNGKYIKLQKLDVEAKEEHMEMIRNYVKAVKPNLTELKLDIAMQDVRWPYRFTFHRLMVAIKATLRKLSLRINWSDEKICWIYDLTGHTFPNVTDLSIKIREVPEDNPIPLRFDFQCLKGFPKLQKLQCIADGINCSESSLTEDHLYFDGTLQWDDRKYDYFSLAITPLKYLKEFHFYLKEPFNADCLALLTKWMPSIKRLAIIANEKTFPIIIDSWSLQKLTLLRGSSVKSEVIEREQTARPIIIETKDDEKTAKE